MVKYNKKNTTYNAIESFDDKTKRFSISPKELANAYKKAQEKVEDGLDRSSIKKMDKTTEKMFAIALGRLESVNIATKNEYNRRRADIDRDIRKMHIGEDRTWNNNYTTFEGQEITDTIGIEKGRNGNNYYYLDESNPMVGPQKVYITENQFNARISDAIRNEVKAEHGIGKELFTLTADDGNKFIITDARDDDARNNSFKDGFKDINMYHVAPDGSITQMKQEDVQALIEANGVTPKDIDKGKTSSLTLENIENVLYRTKDMRRGAKQFLEENMSNTTSTRA